MGHPIEHTSRSAADALHARIGVAEFSLSHDDSAVLKRIGRAMALIAAAR